MQQSYQDCTTSYNSDGGTSRDCDTQSRSVTRYRTERYTEQEPVYGAAIGALAGPGQGPNGGGEQRHTHDEADVRHTHSSADRWHYHGCPDNSADFNQDVICFKKDNVPDCYEDDAPTKSCESNDSVCYIAHD